MASKQSGQSDSLAVTANNIGGIDECEVELPPGNTLLVGENATNRTSFLQAIMAAFGSDNASLKGDAADGSATIAIGNETYSRELLDGDDRTIYRGDPYLDDNVAADLFAFLHGDNEVRRAVTNDGDVRDVLMRPVDIDQIETDIERLKTESDEVEAELERLEELKTELTRRKEERNDLEGEIASLRDERDEVEAAISGIDGEVSNTKEQKSEIESLVSDLKDAESELQRIESDIEGKTDLKTTIEQKLDDLAVPQVDTDEVEVRIESIEEQIQSSYDRQETIQSFRSQLSSILKFHQDLVGETTLSIQELFESGDLDPEEVDIPEGPLTDQLSASASSGTVTDTLLEEDEILCWFCGNSTDRSSVNDLASQLRDLQSQLRGVVRDIDDEIAELQDEKASLEAKRDEYFSAIQQREEYTEKIEEYRSDLESLRERRYEVRSTVEEIEERIDEKRTEHNEELLELHREESQLEVTIEQRERELETVSDRIGDIESELESEPELEDRRESIAAELENLRTKVDQIEEDLVDQFNMHMDQLLEILEYDNLSRIWIEWRTSDEMIRGSGDRAATFDLHVVRESDDGVAYEDELEHLSESEREIAGLVVALTGYLVHDVHEQVPVMLLDSIEMIDSKRLGRLLDYFKSYPDYLIAAILPEHMQELSAEAEDIHVVDWNSV